MMRVLPLLSICAFMGLWILVSRFSGIEDSVFPSPKNVFDAFVEEYQSGQLSTDVIASLFRVGSGFVLGASLGLMFGLLLGSFASLRSFFLPSVNFFRSLSSVAWIPFAILWFGIGDAPVIFLIFLSTFFPVTLSTAAACSSIPQTYFQVASEYGIFGMTRLFRIVLPAILPQIITALRMACGIAWVTVVAAEMLAGKGGLGFAIQDARNGLRTDVLMAEMIVIGSIGVLLDRLILQLARQKSVQWGYDQ